MHAFYSYEWCGADICMWRLHAGLFMALQPRFIASFYLRATFAMAVRFLTGPAVMAAASIAVGLRGTLLHIAIVQVRPEATPDQPNQPSRAHTVLHHRLAH